MVLEFTDNRLSGLLREVEEAIADCEDVVTLWRLRSQLLLFSQEARGKAQTRVRERQEEFRRNG